MKQKRINVNGTPTESSGWGRFGGGARTPIPHLIDQYVLSLTVYSSFSARDVRQTVGGISEQTTDTPIQM